MKTIHVLGYLTLALLLSNCKQAPTPTTTTLVNEVSTTDHPVYVEAIEQAHNKAQLLSHETICFNLQYQFGDRSNKMKVFTTPNSSDIKIEKLDGTITIVSNGDVYTNADSTKWAGEQFSIYTWQYFFMAPFKLSDEGTNWQKLPQQEIAGQLTNVAKLTFDTGTGDAPDDWYILHTDPDTDLLQYLGYIVTGGGKTQAEAEKSARAVHYQDYIQVDGVPIATKWSFHNYDPNNGLGDQLGGATIKNALFMKVDADTYDTTDLTKISG